MAVVIEPGDHVFEVRTRDGLLIGRRWTYEAANELARDRAFQSGEPVEIHSARIQRGEG